MDLNLPIFDQVAGCQNLLIAGMGGGFDLFCGLPIYFELEKRGQTVYLANFSFSEIVRFTGGTRLTESLVGVDAEYDHIVPYFPELYLAQWFEKKRNKSVKIWCFQKTGVRPLLKNYRLLVEYLSICPVREDVEIYGAPIMLVIRFKQPQSDNLSLFLNSIC